MKRRAVLTSLLGRKESTDTAVFPQPTFSSSGLAPYDGEWTFAEASHLLRRCTFGPTKAMLDEAIGLGFQATIDLLFEEMPLPDPPMNYEFEEDTNVPIGSTWVDAPTLQNVAVNNYRNRSLRAWTLKMLLEEGISIREKLTLFWHNHFAVSIGGDPRFKYQHISLLRAFAWGNFRALVKEVTVDPAMLRFLNGNQNTDNAPNENYARELLELFTIGKGPQVGPGDYTNYTEEDVLAIARVLTGWKDLGHNSSDPMVGVGSYFRSNKHDDGEKQLSHRFDNEIIPNLEDLEYGHLIDLIFQKDEVARFICRKLYRWFVYYEINETIEQDIIAPMAQILIDHDYTIKPAIKALVSSTHFFDVINKGPMIKNPIDFSISILKQLEIPFPEDETLRWNSMRRAFDQIKLMEMEYYNPPSVAGWKAYYQEPAFYRIWINATTLQARTKFSDRLAGNGYNFDGERLKVHPLEFVATLDNPHEPNLLIEDISKLLMPLPLSDGQKVALKDILIPGLPDFEWTVEYNDYLTNPDDEDLADAIETRLKDLIRVMLSMPEFYLS